MKRPRPRKPYYELAELCEAWSLSTSDIASYVLEQELTLSVAVAGVRVDVSEIEEDSRGQPYDKPMGTRYVVGTMDVSCTDAWTVLREGSREIKWFRSAAGEYLEIPDHDDVARPILVERTTLVVRRAEKERFEEAQGLNQPTAAVDGSDEAPSSRRGRGAPPKYDWEKCWCEIAATIYDPGVPATQAEWLAMLRDWFSDQVGPDNVPSDSSIKKRLSEIWPRVKPAVGRPSASKLAAGGSLNGGREKGRLSGR
jgi:hypothetical protein